MVCISFKSLLLVIPKGHRFLNFINTPLRQILRGNDLAQCNRAGISDQAHQKLIFASVCQIKNSFFLPCFSTILYVLRREMRPRPKQNHSENGYLIRTKSNIDHTSLQSILSCPEFYAEHFSVTRNFSKTQYSLTDCIFTYLNNFWTKQGLYSMYHNSTSNYLQINIELSILYRNVYTTLRHYSIFLQT